MKQTANPLRGLHRNGTSLHEAIHVAFPAHLVTPRLTDAEQLAQLEARRVGAKPSTPAVLRAEHQSFGDLGHAQHAVTIHFVDGTSQYFPPHTRG